MPQSPLNILQVSTQEIGGGAEKIAWALYSSYRKQGHNSWLAVAYKQSDDPSVLKIPNTPNKMPEGFLTTLHARLKPLEGRVRGVQRVRSNLRSQIFQQLKAEGEQGLENFHYPGSHTILDLPPNTPDLVHCHNLHGGYFDLRFLP